MRRRQYLAASMGLAALTAGVTGATQNESDDGEDEQEVSCPPEEVLEGRLDGTANIEATSASLEVIEGAFNDEAIAEVVVENTGDGASGRIELNVDWYNADGNYVTDNREWLATLGPGERWVAWVEYIGDADEVDDFELSMEVDDQVPSGPNDFVLEESEFQIGEYDAQIVGTMVNETGAEIGFVEAIAVLYDAECTVLGSASTLESDIPEGDTWAFEIPVYGTRLDDIADYHLYLVDPI